MQYLENLILSKNVTDARIDRRKDLNSENSATRWGSQTEITCCGLPKVIPQFLHIKCHI